MNMNEKCNICKESILFFRINNCINCSNQICDVCKMVDYCNNCINKFNEDEKKTFCNKYNLKICIHCDKYVEHECHCNGEIENNNIIYELFDYLTKQIINDDICHF